MTQLNLNFNPALARTKREQAIRQVDEHANIDHRATCQAALDAVIAVGAAFTTDDVIRELGDVYVQIREPRLLGAVVQAASRGKRIVPTGNHVQSKRVENHGRIVREWRPM